MSADQHPPKRKPETVPRGQAREKLMTTALELIVAHGVEGVSSRAINASAGVSPGVLHYHFGSLENLVLELIDRHMEPLRKQRQQLLDEKLQRSTGLSVRDIAETLALPLAGLAINGGDQGYAYVRLIARLWGDRSALLDQAYAHWMGDISRQLFDCYSAALPDVEERTLALRMGLASHVLLRGLEELHTTPRRWQEKRGITQPDPWEHVAQVVEFMVAGLSGAGAKSG